MTYLKTEYGEFLFFYGSVFSQWFKCEFKDEQSISYNCAEQYMMAQKALLFKDEEIYHLIMKVEYPKEHKALGRKIKNFNQVIWDQNCQKIVMQGNYYKFSQNSDLLQNLKNTVDCTLVEASPFDKIWGIGLGESASAELLGNPLNWKGQNLLGLLLTELRDTYFK